MFVFKTPAIGPIARIAEVAEVAGIAEVVDRDRSGRSIRG